MSLELQAALWTLAFFAAVVLVGVWYHLAPFSLIAAILVAFAVGVVAFVYSTIALCLVSR